MSTRETVNFILHVIVGAALAALVCWNSWFIVLATFIYAFLREQAQHRWIIAESSFTPSLLSFKLYSVTKRTFFDFSWVTVRRMFEVLQWVVGAAAARSLWYLA